MQEITAANPVNVTDNVRAALAEDIGSGDITALLIPAKAKATAKLYSRESAVICGIPWAQEVIQQIDPNITSNWLVAEGQLIKANQLLAEFSGFARALLSAERTILNFLQTLSGTATFSHKMASLVAHTGVKLLDTRKTIPGLRYAQKYAVLVGGCCNHRMGLYDAYLIKENHIRSCGSIQNAIATARQLQPGKPLQVEVENLSQLETAIAYGADTVMLDNFSIPQLKEAVRINSQRVKLEASGGITGENLALVAETGVDYISIGSLTKHCKAIDLSILFE